MIGLPGGTRIWIVAGMTDLRRGVVGLSGLVQTALAENPFSGQVLWFDGDGLCLFANQQSSHYTSFD
jgi:transposase